MDPRPSFGNPVAGFIRPPGSPFIFGSFRVTATFGQIDADHPALNPDGTHGHQGVDIGNGEPGGEPILAMADGQVSMAQFLGDARVVRIKHPQFRGYESGYAHLATMDVRKDAIVKRGDRIGTLGKSGATQFHLHIGMKLDRREVDSWPLLEQNQEIDMLKGTLIKRIHNAQTTTSGDGTRFRPSPGTAEPPLTQYPKDTAFTPDFLVEGGLALGSKRWYGGWGITPRGTEFGYISEMVLNPLAPIEVGVPVDDESSADAEAITVDPDMLGSEDT